MRNLQNYKDLIIVLTQKELKVRYKHNLLGYLWSIANPLAFAFVFFIAFKVVMKIKMEDYALFLIAGLFPWQWFANSVTESPTVFIGNASIIKKINFPRNIIPLTIVLQDMIHFILSIPVIVLFLLIYHKTPSISWVYGVPFLLCIQLLTTYGVSLIISSINLFFRDIKHLTVILITFLFYLTPIIYPETMVPERYKQLISLNPIAPLMISWRNLLLRGNLELSYLMTSFTYSILLFIIGYIIYRRLSWRFAEVL
jgi:lipopolysaccharide transport system permease protein